jgi:general secretion pathway protein B
MSYILEALRKSERERQSRQSPGLDAVVSEAPGQRRSLLPWILVGVLVAVNAIALAYFLLHERGSGNSAASHPSPQPLPTPAAMPPAETRIEPNPVVELKAGSANRLPVGEAEQKTVIPQTPREREEASVRSDTRHPPAAKSIEKPRRQRPIEAAAEAPADSEQPAASSGKSYKINVLAYSTAPEERFAIINMSRYTKGDRLPDGAVLEEIEQDGIVLSRHGKHFRVSH